MQIEYNANRRHSALEYRSPAEIEAVQQSIETTAA